MSNSSRFVLAKVEEVTLVFPAHLVAETLLVERTRVLTLPFYGTAIAGCFHAGGKIVPLVSPAQFLGVQTNLMMREVLTVVCLGESAQHLAGVGVLVDQLLGSRMGEKLLSTASGDRPIKEQLFDPILFPKEIFEPQRLRVKEYKAS
jgi:chemotaxis signal transduction protein